MELLPFSPSPPNSTGASIRLFATVTKSNHEMHAHFTLSGDTTTIQWPPPTGVTQGSDLWKQTCFELFLATAHSSEYWEYNFSPSRQWAIYAFTDYRQPAPISLTHVPTIDPPQRSATAFALQAHFTLEPPLIKQPLIMGVSAIIQTTDGQRHFYALRHCSTKPDFHMRASFIVEMD
jgi:hypothetical protein